MAPPIIKQIELLSDKQTNIIQFLEDHDFNERPHLISLLKFPEKQIELIQTLEDYFLDKHHIYPIYVLTQVADYPTQLTLVQNISEVPRYYKQKTKQLNIKENMVFNKIKLKQNQLMNVNQMETKPIIDKYAFEHKLIFEQESFNNYMLEIIHGIRNKNDL